MADEIRNPPPRRTWQIVAGLGVLVLVGLVAFFAAPLVSDSPYVAPDGGEQVVQDGMTATPPQGATSQQITLNADGLEPGAEVTILAGIDPSDLQVVGNDEVSGEGILEAEVEIPAWAERGEPFYYAAEQNGERVGLASVNVIVLDDVAPSGAGGAEPAAQ